MSPDQGRVSGKQMSNKDYSSQTGAPAPLVAAVRKILRPLVGFLLDHGLTYTWLSGLLKSIYVEVAEKEFALAGKEQTDSRITLLTGVHRKDVRRLRREPREDESPPASIFLGAQLVALWLSDKRFCDSKGQPRPLQRRPEGGKRNSFEDLVTSVSTDIRPRAVLDEWLRLGAVEIDDKDRVQLKTEAFVPAKGFEEKVFYFGRNLHDHMAAARLNVQGKLPSFLERSVYYDELTPESVQSLAELSEREGMKTLKELNRRARQLQARDRKSGRGTHRMNFGVYFYESEDPAPEDSQEE